MLKFFCLLTSIVLAFPCFAIQTGSLEGSLSCMSRRNDFGAVRLSARLILLPRANEGTLWDPIAQVQVADSEEVETGRRKHLDADRNYQPRKYKGHSQFDLSNLVSIKTFGDFRPSDSCILKWIVPNAVFANAPANGTPSVEFVTPLTIACDQSGTTISLDCKVIPRDN